MKTKAVIKAATPYQEEAACKANVRDVYCFHFI